MLVEFKRVVQRESEDEGVETIHPPIAIDVRKVTAVFGSEEDGTDVTVIRVGERGFKVQGTYAEVIAKINGTQVG